MPCETAVPSGLCAADSTTCTSCDRRRGTCGRSEAASADSKGVCAQSVRVVEALCPGDPALRASDGLAADTLCKVAADGWSGRAQAPAGRATTRPAELAVPVADTVCSAGVTRGICSERTMSRGSPEPATTSRPRTRHDEPASGHGQSEARTLHAKSPRMAARTGEPQFVGASSSLIATRVSPSIR